MGLPTLAVVLKSGGEFTPAHVRWLKAQTTTNLSIPHQFVCLSDIDVPEVETIPLTQDWPGWWSKLELFRHDLGTTLYMDLDTVIVGSLDDMAGYGHSFTALQALSSDQRPCLNSGLMAWRGSRLDLYEEFKSRARFHMEHCNRKGNWGDQGFIHHHVGQWQAWQNLFPGRVVSYKLHLKQKLPPPPGTSVVCFHGQPRPWQVRRDWIPNDTNELARG